MSDNLNIHLPEYFREFLTELNHHDVEYMLIGGYAMGTYGHVRTTGDLDIFIEATRANAKKMMQACIAYGIEEENLLLDMFMVPRMVVIGEAPLRIEIIKKLDTVDFKYAYQRVKTMQVDNLAVPVVNLDDLIRLKHAAVKGRNKARDSEDLTFLQKLKAALTNSGKL
ncbi:MAG: hypothetical protein WA960_14570 [Tunicatimonas sp.]